MYDQLLTVRRAVHHRLHASKVQGRRFQPPLLAAPLFSCCLPSYAGENIGKAAAGGLAHEWQIGKAVHDYQTRTGAATQPLRKQAGRQAMRLKWPGSLQASCALYQ